MMAYFLRGVGGGHTKVGLPHINVWLDRVCASCWGMVSIQ